MTRPTNRPILNRPILTLLCAIAIPPLALAQQPAQPPSPAPAAPPADTLKSLSPKDRQLVTARAKRCLRLPDGSIADVNNYYQLHETVQDDLRKRTDTVERRSGNFVAHERVGPSRWELDPAGPARQWGVEVKTGEEVRGRKEQVLVRTSDSVAPALVWPQRDQFPASFRVFYIDADKPDPLTKDRAVPGVVTVEQQLPDDIVVARLRSPAYPRRPVYSRIYIKLPDADLARKGFLSGRYILWPDATIRHPETGTTPLEAAANWSKPPAIDPSTFWSAIGPDRYLLSAQAVDVLKGFPRIASSPDACVYRYIPAAALTVAPEELAELLTTGALQLFDWSRSFRDGDQKPIWTQRPVTLGPPRSAP